MLSKEDIKKLAFDTIRQHSEISIDDSTMDMDFIEYFEEDSLDIVEQCMEMEAQYGISLSYIEVKKCMTPRKLIDVVYSKVKEKELIN